MNRKILYWKLRDRELQLGGRTLVMAVLNITPDSFSDGGRYSDPEKAYARALELQELGADIIDIGAESTRPGAETVSADEEWRRLVPVLKRLRGALSIPVSIDTYKSETAERALAYDVQILNDPSGLTFDPALAKMAASENLGLILNHMRGRPEQWAKMGPLPDAIGTVTRELDAAVNRARHAGVDRQRIMVDPGIGFGKRKEQNSELIAQLGHLSKLDLPILVGVSRKSFLAQGTETETLFATAAAVTAAVLNGAHLVRVHDVKEMLAVVRIADEISRASEQPVEATEERPAKRAPARMQSWEEERPKPTRPPMKVIEKPVTETPPAAVVSNSADTQPAEETKLIEAPLEAAAADKETAPLAGEQAPSTEKPAPAPRQEDTRVYPPATPRKFDRAPKREFPPSNRPPNRPFERSNDRPYNRPNDRGNDRPYSRPDDRGGDRPNDRPYNRPNDRPRDLSSDRSGGTGGDRPSYQPGNRPFRRDDRAAAGGSNDRPFRKPGDRPFGKPFSKPFGKPTGDRPFSKPFAKSSGDRPFGKPMGKPFGKPFGRPGNRPQGDRPHGDRPPSGDRPYNDRPRGDRPFNERPQGDRPPSGGGRTFNDRPRNDRSFNERPFHNRPQGDRPSADRPQGDRPQGDRPPGNRPPFNKFGPPRGGRPGGRPGGGGPPRKPFRRD